MVEYGAVEIASADVGIQQGAVDTGDVAVEYVAVYLYWGRVSRV